MLEQTNIPIMQKAVRVVKDMSEDARIRDAVRIREKALHDEASALNSARMEGEAIGLEKGEAKGVSSVVRKMRLADMSDEQINSILGL